MVAPPRHRATEWTIDINVGVIHNDSTRADPNVESTICPPDELLGFVQAVTGNGVIVGATRLRTDAVRLYDRHVYLFNEESEDPVNEHASVLADWEIRGTAVVLDAHDFNCYCMVHTPITIVRVSDYPENVIYTTD